MGDYCSKQRIGEIYEEIETEELDEKEQDSLPLSQSSLENRVSVIETKLDRLLLWMVKQKKQKTLPRILKREV